MDIREIVPGEYDVTVDGAVHRVLIPAGVGLPGVPDEDLAGAVVVELQARGRSIPDALDVSAVLRDDPGLLLAVERRVSGDTL